MSLLNVELQVEPQVLFEQASNMNGILTKMKSQLDTIEQIFKSTENNWTGEAADLYRSQYEEKKAIAEEIILRLQEHPKDLIEISGVYSSTEKANEDLSDSLPADVIV